MVQEIQPQRKIERLVLLIFSVYDIAVFSVSVIAGWKVWVSALMLISLVMCWIIYAGQYKDYRFRAGFVAGMMQVLIFLFATSVKDMYKILPFFLCSHHCSRFVWACRDMFYVLYLDFLGVFLSYCGETANSIRNNG
jgi:hypothetical protein